MSQPIHLQDQNDRPTGQAMWRGTRGLCPSCGQGKMFRGYLKVSDHCPNCDEELHHQRADDGPALSRPS